MKNFLSDIFRRTRRIDQQKKTLYLHIGMGKTGTTALQLFFADNRHALEQQGILYPKLGEVSSAHHKLSPHVPRFLEQTWNFMSASDWAPQVANTRCQCILLSSELISRTSPEKVGPFCDSVRALFDLKVVIYVRRQDDIVMASYNQHIKSGMQKRPLLNIYQDMIPKFDYDALLSPWEESVGADSIIVRPYEHGQFFDGDLRKDFLKNVLGVEIGDRFRFDSTNPNPGLSKVTGEYLRMINNVVEDEVRKKRFLDLLLDLALHPRNDLEWDQDKEAYLPADKRLEIIEKCHKSNAAVACKYLQRDDGHLFHNVAPEMNQPWHGNQLSTQTVASLSRYLAEQDPGLMRWLANHVPQYCDDEKYAVKSAARFLAAAL
jgi:hypothetical protein